MRRFWPFWCAFWLLCLAPGVVLPQMLQGIVAAPSAAAPAGYTGPGDIVSYSIFYSCGQSYSAAYGLASGNACALRRSSDNGTCTVLAAAAGNVDYTVGTPCAGATALAWATRSTFTGTIGPASTAMTTTGDPCTAIAGDQLLGTGITAQTTIASVTSCAAGAGVYVLSASWTLGPEAITDLIPTFASTIYDQVAGNACGGASCNWVQATTANQYQVFLPGGIALTNAYLQATASTQTEVSANNLTPSGTLSMSVVMDRAVGIGACAYLRVNGAANRLLGQAIANKFQLTGASGSQAATANDAAWHAVNSVTDSGNTVINVDGVETTGGTVLSTVAGVPGMVGAASTTCRLAAAGAINTFSFTSGQRTSLNSNYHTFWNF